VTGGDAAALRPERLALVELVPFHVGVLALGGEARVFLLRAFVLSPLVLVAVAVGSAVAPLLVSAFGTRGALIATGAFLPVASALAWSGLRALDAAAAAPTAELELLRAQALFAPLPGPVLESPGGDLEPVLVAAGELVVRAGEAGDRFP
jgi:hypothetical protein